MKENNLKFVLLLLILVGGFSSCKRSCSGYDQADKSIIPFSTNETLTYISNTNDTLNLLVQNAYYAEAKTWTGSAKNVDCHPKAFYEALDKQTNISLKELHDWNIAVSFCDETPYLFHLRILDEENNLKCRHLKNKEIGGKEYLSVWQVEDLSGKRRIDKFKKAAYYGIIEFHDRSTGLTWTQKVK